MTKTGFKEYLNDLVMRKPDAAEAALGVETATYMAGFDYGGQKVKVAADKQEEIDKALKKVKGKSKKKLKALNAELF